MQENNIQSTAERILSARDKALEDDTIKQNELAQWKQSINTIAESEHGQLLFSKMVKFMSLYSDFRGINPATMAEVNGSRAFYLKYIRPYLEETNRQKVEK